MSIFNINGKVFSGKNMTFRDGKLIIDGDIVGNDVRGVVEVRVLEGEIHRLEVDGSVTCNNVTGSVNAGGSVNCDKVGGNVNAGGSVNCNDVGGNVSAGGSIRRG